MLCYISIIIDSPYHIGWFVHGEESWGFTVNLIGNMRISQTSYKPLKDFSFKQRGTFLHSHYFSLQRCETFLPSHYFSFQRRETFLPSHLHTRIMWMNFQAKYVSNTNWMTWNTWGGLHTWVNLLGYYEESWCSTI